MIRDIKRLIRAGESLGNGAPQPFQYLPKLVALGFFETEECKEWLRVNPEPLGSILSFLESSVRSALEEPPDRRPTNNRVRRKKQADQTRKEIQKLIESIHALEQDEEFTWAFALSRHTGTAYEQLTDKFPLAKWKRSIPPAPRLVPGWQQGAHASLEAMPLLLGVLNDAVDDWESQDGWPIRTNKGERQARTHFVKHLSYVLRRRYGQPSDGLVASLADVFFSSMGTLSAEVVNKVVKGSRDSA